MFGSLVSVWASGDTPLSRTFSEQFQSSFRFSFSLWPNFLLIFINLKKNIILFYYLKKIRAR